MSSGGTKRAARRSSRRNRPDVGRDSVRKPTGRRRPTPEVAAEQRARQRRSTAPPLPREPRAPRTGPQRAIPSDRVSAPKTARQAKARAKARKAKAPKVVRRPLRERILLRLSGMDLRPHALIGKVPFVVLIIATLGVGLGITLWLSTDAAARSYQLGSVREENRALMRQKEALERDVRTAESAPALAEAARELGMIPSRNTAHLVQDPAGNWVVVGDPRPAEGVPLPPLNTKLPDEQPPPRAVTPASPREVPVPVAPRQGRARSALPPTAPGTVPPQAVVPAPQGGVLMLPSAPPGTPEALPAPLPAEPAEAVAPPAELLPPPDPVPHPIDGVPIPPGPPGSSALAQVLDEESQSTATQEFSPAFPLPTAIGEPVPEAGR